MNPGFLRTDTIFFSETLRHHLSERTRLQESNEIPSVAIVARAVE